MTVRELRDVLEALVADGHAETNVIARCEFTIRKGNGHYSDVPLTRLTDLYYQSGDIEMAFSDNDYDEKEVRNKNDK